MNYCRFLIEKEKSVNIIFELTHGVLFCFFLLSKYWMIFYVYPITVQRIRRLALDNVLWRFKSIRNTENIFCFRSWRMAIPWRLTELKNIKKHWAWKFVCFNTCFTSRAKILANWAPYLDMYVIRTVTNRQCQGQVWKMTWQTILLVIIVYLFMHSSIFTMEKLCVSDTVLLLLSSRSNIVYMWWRYAAWLNINIWNQQFHCFSLNYHFLHRECY
jgi:hypothetical protein